MEEDYVVGVAHTSAGLQEHVAADARVVEYLVVLAAIHARKLHVAAYEQRACRPALHHAALVRRGVGELAAVERPVGVETHAVDVAGAV